MKVRRELAPVSTLEAFADAHGLELVITERRMDRWQRENRLKRFLARFDHVEVSDGSMLIGTYGEGDTEDEAIRGYADLISSEKLVVDAWKATRREIQAPRLFPAPANEVTRE